jgi:kynurenine formamidase
MYQGAHATLSRMARLIDVSHAIEHGMVTYKGLPAPLICDFMSREDSRRLYAAGTEFHIGKIEIVANTGTYVDAPFHRYAASPDLSELPLESLADSAIWICAEKQCLSIRVGIAIGVRRATSKAIHS